MRLTAIQFTSPVPVFGTGLRFEHFESSAGWLIDTDARGVVLERKANPAQNIRAVPAFRIVGVGFCEPVEVERGVEQAGVPGDGACADVAAKGEQRADASGAPQAAKQAQGGPKKAPRKVTP